MTRPYQSKAPLKRSGGGADANDDAAFYQHRETKAADPDPYRALNWHSRTTKYDVADLIHRGRRGKSGNE